MKFIDMHRLNEDSHPAIGYVLLFLKLQKREIVRDAALASGVSTLT